MEHENFDSNHLSSSGHGTAPPEDHDVYISVNGQDIAKSFASHLNAALIRKGLKTYLGNESETEMSPSFHKQYFKVAIIVFSRNYVYSKECMDKLLVIIERANCDNTIVVPVFYDVDPSTVRKQTGSYTEAFTTYAQELRDDLEKVQSWRKALTKAASYSGWDCTINVRTEHEIVEEIAKDVVEKLDRVCVGDLDFQIDYLEKMTQLQQEFSQEMHNSVNERNFKATLERFNRLKMEKKFRLLRLTPDLLSHLEISKATNTYF